MSELRESVGVKGEWSELRESVGVKGECRS